MFESFFKKSKLKEDLNNSLLQVEVLHARVRELEVTVKELEMENFLLKSHVDSVESKKRPRKSGRRR